MPWNVFSVLKCPFILKNVCKCLLYHKFLEIFYRSNSVLLAKARCLFQRAISARLVLKARKANFLKSPYQFFFKSGSHGLFFLLVTFLHNSNTFSRIDFYLKDFDRRKREKAQSKETGWCISNTASFLAGRIWRRIRRILRASILRADSGRTWNCKRENRSRIEDERSWRSVQHLCSRSGEKAGTYLNDKMIRLPIYWPK